MDSNGTENADEKEGAVNEMEVDDTGGNPLNNKVSDLSACELFDLIQLAIDAKLNHLQPNTNSLSMTQGIGNGSPLLNGFNHLSSPQADSGLVGVNHIDPQANPPLQDQIGIQVRKNNNDGIEKAQALARLQHLQELSREASSVSMSNFSDDFDKEEAELCETGGNSDDLVSGRRSTTPVRSGDDDTDDGHGDRQRSTTPTVTGQQQADTQEPSNRRPKSHTYGTMNELHVGNGFEMTRSRTQMSTDHADLPMFRTRSMPSGHNNNMPLHMVSQQSEKMPRIDSGDLSFNIGMESGPPGFSFMNSEEFSGVFGCDPRCWVVAAGILEKKRDGKLRDGWANRFFVLTTKRLYYFRVPKKDTTGDQPTLLGEERGSIRLVEIQDVRYGAGSAGWYMYMTLGKQGMKKGAFQGGTNTLNLRCGSPEVGKAWEVALENTRQYAQGVFKTQTSNGPARAPSPSPQDHGDSFKSTGSLKTPSSPSNKFQPIRTLRHFGTSIGTSLSKDSGVKSPTYADTATQSGFSPVASPINEGKPPLLKFKSFAAISVPDEEPNKVIRESAIDMIDTTLKKNDTEEKFKKKARSTLDKAFHKRDFPTETQLISMLGLWHAFTYFVLLNGADGYHLWLLNAIFTAFLIYLYHHLVVLHRDTFSIFSVATEEYRSILKDLRTCFEMSADDDFSDTDATKKTGVKKLNATPSSDDSVPAPVPEPSDSGKPKAGCTGYDNTGNDPDIPWQPTAFAQESGTDFMVRCGPNYKANKNKTKSMLALYDIVGQDLVKDDKIIKNIHDQFELPPPRPGIDDVDAIRKIGLPRVIIFNVQLFLQSPPMFGTNDSDVGCSFVQYYVIKPETVKAFQEGNLTPAMKLWKRYVDEWETSEEMRKRLKGICVARNIDDLGSTISKFSSYNGKPFILNKCVSRKADTDFIEFDVNVRLFSLIAKRLIYTFVDYLKKLHISIAIVIQAESDEEMPEGVLASAHVRNIDPTNHCKHMDDL